MIYYISIKYERICIYTREYLLIFKIPVLIFYIFLDNFVYMIEKRIIN